MFCFSIFTKRSHLNCTCLLHTSQIGIKRPQSYDLLPYRSLSCHNCFVSTTIDCSSRCDGCISKIELAIAQTFKTSFDRLKCYALEKHIYGLEGQAFFAKQMSIVNNSPLQQISTLGGIIQIDGISRFTNCR